MPSPVWVQGALPVPEPIADGVRFRDDVIGDDDRRIGAIVLALTILATIVGYAVTNSTFPRTIPLQAGLQKPLTPITTEGTVGVSSVTFTAANWNIPQTITVTGVRASRLAPESSVTDCAGVTRACGTSTTSPSTRTHPPSM